MFLSTFSKVFSKRRYCDFALFWLNKNLLRPVVAIFDQANAIPVSIRRDIYRQFKIRRQLIQGQGQWITIFVSNSAADDEIAVAKAANAAREGFFDTTRD